jgi:predicted nicotinamide N-methyase
MHSPSVHGNRVWKSTWLLIDYLNRKGLPEGARVMEVGCGWGLAGIYCAKRQGATVTAVDTDSEILPYLHLHADVNQVEITTLKKDFIRLKVRDFSQTDVLIGADICFWDSLVHPLRRLILRALRAGVQQVLISDPGRSPFEQLGDYFVDKRNGRVFDWTAQRPRRSQGRILKIAQD